MKYVLLSSLLTISMINAAGEVENGQTPRYRNRHFMEKIARYFGYRQERFEFENTPTAYGEIPLHSYAYLNSIKSIQDALDAGAPINYKNDNNLSPFNALRLSNCELSTLIELIDNGAFVDHMQEVEGRKPVALERGEKPLFDNVQEEKTTWCTENLNSANCRHCKLVDTLLRERIKKQPAHLYEEYAQSQTE